MNINVETLNAVAEALPTAARYLCGGLLGAAAILGFGIILAAIVLRRP